MDSCLEPFCTNDCKFPSNFVTQTGWSYTGKLSPFLPTLARMANVAGRLIGASMAIGVFLWGTDSTIDRAVFASRPSPDRFHMLPGWNGTGRIHIAAAH